MFFVSVMKALLPTKGPNLRLIDLQPVAFIAPSGGHSEMKPWRLLRSDTTLSVNRYTHSGQSTFQLVQITVHPENGNNIMWIRVLGEVLL